MFGGGVLEGNVEWYKVGRGDGASRGDGNSARHLQVSQDNEFSGHSSCDWRDDDDDGGGGDYHSCAGPAGRRSWVQ